ncbi:MAG: sulfatase-like hydrolase/transferase, partial [Candidatus Aminicenantes bacterium]|nr:sulfatase-like hydrolase/transferase [Candidatus Aminicenantes bacterium]
EGFDYYEDKFPAERWYLTADEVNRKVVPWLESRHDKPFFVWVHYSDPHDPYSPPDMPEDLKLRLNGREVGSYRLSDYAWNKVELDLRAGENILLFETKNPYQTDPSKFAAWIDPIRFGPEDGMKDVSWEHTQRWLIVPETGTHFLKSGAFITLRAPTARKVTMEFRGQIYLTTSAVRELYRREVEYLDGKIGELLAALDRLGLRDNTAVVAVGDHGEGLGEYNLESGAIHYGHVNFLEKIYLHVPLIVSIPGDRRNGTRRTEPVTLLDIAPTFIRLFGLEGFRGLPGRDLLTLPKGATMPVFAETYRPESDRNRFALFEAPWHMILDPELGRRKIYNLSADPAESADLWGTASVPADVSRDFEKRLGHFARQILAEKKDASIDPKAEEMLRSLGYIGK